MRYRCPRPTGEPTSPTGCRGRSLRSARGAMTESHGHWRARGCDLDGSAETGSLEGIVTHLGPLEVDARATLRPAIERINGERRENEAPSPLRRAARRLTLDD